MTSGADEGAVAPLHLLKMAVGVASLDELHPDLAGGSLYWVIRGQIRVRQRITGFKSERDDKGRAYCLIGVDPELMPTQWRPWRPFQGWRYLTAADAPPDLVGGAGSPGAKPGAMPERLVAELRALGLL